jgi:sulfate adenylyltransferase
VRADTAKPATVRLTPAECNIHEIYWWGGLEPLRGYLSRADLDSVQSRGQLADGTPWLWPWMLRPNGAVGANQTVELREPEGHLIGTTDVTEVWSSAGLDHVAGEVRLARAPQTGMFRGMHREPSSLVGSGSRTALAVAGPVSPASVAGALRVAADDGGPLLLMPMVGVGEYGYGESTVATARTTLALQEALGDRVEVAALPISPDELDEPPGLWLAAKTAHAFGVGTLLVDREHADLPTAPGTARVMRSPQLPGLARPLADGLERVAEVSSGRGRRGLVVLMTGLPASGKSTIARELRDWIVAGTTRTVTLLDGDIVRATLSPDLSFSRADRLKNMERLATVAAECCRHGGVVLCAPVAPHAQGRELFHRIVRDVADFLLVHVATPVEECQRRDPKGLYAAAAAGKLSGLTGVDDDYEEPTDAHLRVGLDQRPPEHAVRLIRDELLVRGWLEAAPWTAALPF